MHWFQPYHNQTNNWPVSNGDTTTLLTSAYAAVKGTCEAPTFEMGSQYITCKACEMKIQYGNSQTKQHLTAIFFWCTSNFLSYLHDKFKKFYI